MARRRQQQLARGHAAHRRTEGDYMGVLLGAATLEDWRDVVNGAKAAAKAGDPPARAWLAQYLMDRPHGKAPTPLTVVVQQLNGADPLVERLARPLIDRQRERDGEWRAMNYPVRGLDALPLRWPARVVAVPGGGLRLARRGAVRRRGVRLPALLLAGLPLPA